MRRVRTLDRFLPRLPATESESRPREGFVPCPGRRPRLSRCAPYLVMRERVAGTELEDLVDLGRIVLIPVLTDSEPRIVPEVSGVRRMQRWPTRG
jgi:hypothetical protein